MATAKRKMPIRVETLTFDGQYEGWEVTMRTNPPMRVFADLASGDFDRIVTGLSEIVREWNFVDEDGKPFPDPSEDGAMNEVPYDLAMKIASGFSERIAALPPD